MSALKLCVMQQEVRMGPSHTTERLLLLAFIANVDKTNFSPIVDLVGGVGWGWRGFTSGLSFYCRLHLLTVDRS